MSRAQALGPRPSLAQQVLGEGLHLALPARCLHSLTNPALRARSFSAPLPLEQ